jgi:hypothetical protein
MVFRVLLAAVAIFALTTLAFGDPAQVLYWYPGDGNCVNPPNPPLTSGGCWTGTAIPEGTACLYIFRNGVEWDCIGSPFAMNGSVGGCPDGYFFMLSYCTGFESGDQTYLEVRWEGCVYRTATYTLAAGANEEYLFPGDWVHCSCANPGCDVKDEQSSRLGGSSSKGTPTSSK